jgi:hypothetical protein
MSTDNGAAPSEGVATAPTPTNPPAEPPYNPKDLWLKEVKYADGSQNVYEPIRISDEERHTPKFQLPSNVDVTVAALSELYLTDSLLKTIADNTDAYAASKGRNIRTVSKAEVLRLFAIILYMGVVRLPAKEDYWKKTGMWPIHKPCQHILAKCFKEIFNNIHRNATPPDPNAEEEEEPEGETENSERIDNDNNNSNSDTNSNSTTEEEVDPVN